MTTMKKILIICISTIMAIALHMLFCIVYAYIADNAEEYYDEPHLSILAGFDSEGFDSSFSRVNYDGFNEARSRSIPEKTCHIKILNYLYGKKNCIYSGNVRKVTLYSSDLKGTERDSSQQIEESIYFSEMGDSIITNSYYKGKLYRQWFAIYNGNLIEKEFAHDADEGKFNETNYYYDGDELIKIVRTDSFLTTAIESYSQDFRQKKQILNSYIDVFSRANSSAENIVNITLMPYEGQWIWYYDDNNRLIEKSNKVVYNSDWDSGMYISLHESRNYDILRHFAIKRKYIYSYDNDTLAKVEVFGEKDKRIGTFRFKNSKTKRRWDYVSSRLRSSEEYEYDDKNRLRKMVANLRDYPYMDEYDRVILFDTLSNITSDSLFNMAKISFLRNNNYTDVKKKHYSLKGRLESVEHIVRKFNRKIPLIGFTFTTELYKSENFVYAIKYDSIGNPDRINRKYFENNQLRNHTAFTLSYEYK